MKLLGEPPECCVSGTFVVVVAARVNDPLPTRIFENISKENYAALVVKWPLTAGIIGQVLRQCS